MAKFGKALMDESQNVAYIQGLSMTLSVTPGPSPMGKAVQTRFGAIAKEIQDNLSSFSGTLYGVGDQLVKLANKYSATEDLSTIDVQALSDVIAAITPHYDNANTVLPNKGLPNPTDIPLPSSPPPAPAK
jgi:hypothetical protein